MMNKAYSTNTYLKAFDILNKYNLKKKSDIFFIKEISFELALKKEIADLNFNYKLFFYLYIIFNTFSHIHYRIIPGTNRNVSFSVKFEGLITNKAKVEFFINQFLLEKRNVLLFKTTTQKIVSKTNFICLNLMFPLKEYISINALKLQNISYSNLEQEIILLTFKLSKKFVQTFFLNNLLPKYTHYFSFWKILVKNK